jgi:N-acetylmuramoyl-L-alanine amidase
VKPEVRHNVRNQSSRDGKRPRLIVLHTTEGHNRPGVGDLRDLAAFFDTRGVDASSHVANDAEGHDARMVPDAAKAWTQSTYNAVSLSIEQIGFAATRKREWFRNAEHQLANTARWIAWWSAEHDIPIRRGVGVAGLVVRSGVVSHRQLGIAGGGHVDPGSAYPLRYVLALARYFYLRRNRPGSPEHKKAIRKVNRIRRHYGLKPVN